MQATNLFIGSLSYNTTDDTLKSFFETIGEVKSARVVTDRFSGRSKGFGFVEFEDASNNQKAIEALDGKTLDGREITVSPARPKTEGGSRDGGGNRKEFNSFRRSSR